MSQEEIQNSVDFDALALKARATLSLYMPFQIKTMEAMYGNHEEARKHAVDWKELYSPEFEEVFLLEARKQLEQHREITDSLSLGDLLSPKEVEKKIEALHLLEKNLMLKMKEGSSLGEDFVKWHDVHAKNVLRIIHTNPDFIETFLDASSSEEERDKIIEFVKGEILKEEMVSVS